MEASRNLDTSSRYLPSVNTSSNLNWYDGTPYSDFCVQYTEIVLNHAFEFGIILIRLLHKR